MQKTIIIFLITFLLVGFSWLAYTERKQQQINNQWFLYFQNPTDNSLDFVIENYTKNSEFVWKLKNNEKIIRTEKITVLKNAPINVSIENNPQGRLIIEVTHKNKKKFIYKIQ